MITFFGVLSSSGSTSGNIYWPYFTPRCVTSLILLPLTSSPWDLEVCVMRGKSQFSGVYDKARNEWKMVEETCEADVGTTQIVMGVHYILYPRGNHCLGSWKHGGDWGTFYLVLQGVLHALWSSNYFR